MQKSRKRKSVITHLITTLNLGGAESMLFKLVACTKDSSPFRHHVISLTGLGALGLEMKKIGIPVTALYLGRNINSLSGILNLYYILRSYKPSLIQTWLYHSDLTGLVIGKILRAPKIVWNIRCSNMDLKQYAITTRLIFSLLTQLSHLPDLVIFNSETGRRFHLKAGYTPKRSLWIPNGFDTDCFKPNTEARKRFRHSHGIGKNVPVIGMVARYDPMKDHTNFFHAASQIKERLEDVRFVLVGKGVHKSNQEIQVMLRSFRLVDHALLLGENYDLWQIYPAFDICTLSSSFGEGFPNVLGEAMACGVPCVATDVGDAAHLIGDTGKTIPARQSNALAQAWLEMLSLPMDKKRQLSSNARKRITKKFSINTIAQRYEQIYTELIQY